jgi:hypothetical protein
MKCIFSSCCSLGFSFWETKVWFGAVIIAGALILFGAGCTKSVSEAALDTDANGYVCRNCQAKFYTERKVFADRCPGCKSMQLSQVVGFVCGTDGAMSVASRGSGAMPCEKCGKVTSSIAIPKESDLKVWGAAKKAKAEVGS